MSWRDDDRQASRPWVGPVRPYSLVREVLILLGVCTVLVVVAAALFGSPAKPATTLQDWATDAPGDFVATAVSELDGTSETATYGPPYNRGACGNAPITPDCAQSLQKIGPLAPEKWAGIRQPVDAAEMVVTPLRAVSGTDAALAAALTQWDQATPQERTAWATAYSTALAAGSVAGDRISVTTSPEQGPVPVMMEGWLAAGRTGAIDASLVQGQSFFTTDYTLPMLLLEDGDYFEDIGNDLELAGGTWGQMNELGSWPGAWWLAPYTLWYQIPPGSTSQAGDLWAAIFVGVIALITILLPFIPGLRSLPRHLGVHRVVWRHYHEGAGRR